MALEPEQNVKMALNSGPCTPAIMGSVETVVQTLVDEYMLINRHVVSAQGS
jgi:hypothetical protein